MAFSATAAAAEDLNYKNPSLLHRKMYENDAFLSHKGPSYAFVAYVVVDELGLGTWRVKRPQRSRVRIHYTAGHLG